jgi:hypothetical protein
MLFACGDDPDGDGGSPRHFLALEVLSLGIMC